jgi:ABC-type branched-subunit amino acid transport system substrate-binding protein
LLAVAAAGLGVAVAHSEEGPHSEEAPQNAEQSSDVAKLDVRAGSYAGTPESLTPFRESEEPYRYFFRTPPQHRGPGREKPEPLELQTVRIGLLAPLEGTNYDHAGQALQRGVKLAFHEANQDGGYQGRPFELISRNDQALWGSSANTLVELAYAEKVWAIIGSIDSNSTHVALRAALKAEVSIVNVGSSDPTITETGIPWIIRCTPDDRQTSYRLARLLFEEMGLSRVAVLRSNNRYGRFGVREFRDAARRLHRPLPLEIQFPPGREGLDHRLDRLEAADVDAVVLWGEARQMGFIARRLRERGMDQPIAGTDQLVSQEFLELAGEAAEGVVATLWMPLESQDEAWLEFRKHFRERFDTDPDAFSTYGYDAGNLVVDAVRQAGLNRVRIRDALTDIRAHEGVAGTFQFDATSNNIAQPVLAVVRGGHFVPR